MFLSIFWFLLSNMKDAIQEIHVYTCPVPTKFQVWSKMFGAMFKHAIFFTLKSHMLHVSFGLKYTTIKNGKVGGIASYTPTRPRTASFQPLSCMFPHGYNVATGGVQSQPPRMHMGHLAGDHLHNSIVDGDHMGHMGAINFTPLWQ